MRLFIVRLAGLLADAVTPFASDRCHRALLRLQSLEDRLAVARREVAERLYALVHDAPREQRRFLLDLKRDSFNGRSLGKYRALPQWLEVLERVGPGLEQILLLEQQLADESRELLALHAAERRREGEHLAQFLTDRHFLRGVALSSSVLTEQLPRLARRPPAEYERRERRLELGLLRFVSRSALKLSPFSTLTRIGIGLEDERADDRALSVTAPGHSRERSRMRLQRFVSDLFADLLARVPPLRERLGLAVNDTVERAPDGRYAFLRPGAWEATADGSDLKYRNPALVQVTLAGPVAQWLLARREAPLGSLRELLLTLHTQLGGALEQLRATLDRFLDIGLLVLLWPWPSSDVQPERRLLAELEALAGDASLDPVREALRRLLERLEGYAGSSSPADAAADLKRSVREVLAAVGPLVVADSRVGLVESREWFCHEDVLLVGDGPQQEVARLAQGAAREILASLAPLVRLSDLANRRTEALSTLGAFAAERWPGRCEVGFLEFFQAVLPLFQDFVRADAATRAHSAFRAPLWNPLGLAELDELARCRRATADAVETCITADGETLRLDLRALERLLADVPPAWIAVREFCAFLQPLDDRAGRWVLNQLAEGAGRMSSRYTVVMDPMLGSRFAAAAAASAHQRDAELVDILCTAGHTANVRLPHTRRVLATDGEAADLPAERRLLLRDLFVRLSPTGALPQLVDRDGRTLWPVHLGALSYRYLPSLLKLLVVFGPGELRLSVPRRAARHEGDLQVLDRHQVGNVVYQRRAWLFETAPLRAALSGRSAAEAYRFLHRWRSDRSLPEQVFLAEPQTPGPSPTTKPQYISFTSCLLVEIFRAALETEAPFLRLFEALPAPHEQFATADGRRWAVELQLDSSGHSLASLPFPGGKG